MAPSATAWNPPSEETTNGHMVTSENGHNNLILDDPTKLYRDAYSHGYTEGYISGFTKSDLPKQIPIAIVGMSCRLPGNVSTPDEFWELCSRARTGWSEVPKARFNNATFHHPNPGKNGCFNAVGGNFLKEDVGLFDAPFFSLTAQEATSMDPQQRILLECTFEALDSAGIPKHEIIGKQVGVFIGGSFSEYESQLFSDTETIPMHQSTGCAFAMQSNRISHFFDLRGPSFTMDTACSSSLVALHQACQSLRNGESKSAIVGGCHLNMLPEFWISMSKSRLFSDQGRSFSFDNRGTGYGRGEGCGIIVLKPLDQALKDNDIIRSVIVASGINQDGKTPGITMPNGSAQESLMRSVYESAGINPRDTGYVEAHGTGTKVGDPIEAAALHNIFGEDRTARNPLFIGSVKSNIGHLEAASGIISVIKTALMLERGFILPNYDFKQPNEKIPFSKWHLKVPISQRPWPRPKRFASVNNFGFGGTNAHVVLERAPFLKENDSPDSADSTSQPRKLFVLSANDKGALEALMKNLGIYLEQRPEIFQNDLMSNIAYTLGERRSLMQWRVAIPAPTSFDLIQALNGGKIVPVRETEPLRIGFIFTGQGAQWHAMGRELCDQYPVFASTLEACNRCLMSFGASFSLIDELNKDPETSLINEAQISQPACTAIQLAITDLLRSWNVLPTAVTGHSSGEIAAAYAANILPLDSCMAISYYRGLATVALRKKFPDLKGSMMAVGCTKEEAEPLIAELTAKEARIACFNSPTSLTISGDEPAIDELQKLMEAKKLFNRKLQVDVAYHSHHMSLVAKDYRAFLQNLDKPRPTKVKFHSSLVGHLVEGELLQPSYWVDNLTKAVRFSEALTTMCAPADGYKTGVNMLIEIGPHSALAGPVKQILKACSTDAMKIPYASALVRKKDAIETALELAAMLFVKGANLDFGAINLPKSGQKPTLLIDMPRYPWNHQTKYWHESRIMQTHKNRSTPRHDLLGVLAVYSNDLEPTWRNILRIDNLPWLRHHKIQSLTLFPMSGFIAMAVEAASQRANARNIKFDEFELRDVLVHAPLVVTEEDIEITLQLRPHQNGSSVSSETWDEFRIHSWVNNKGWTEHCQGLVVVKSMNTTEGDPSQGVNISHVSQRIVEDITKQAATVVDKTKIYDALSDLGVTYGSSFQGMNDCKAGDSASIANITTVDTKEEMPQAHQSASIIHPALLEQLIEMYWPILGAGRDSVSTIYLPSTIRRLSISNRVTELTQTPGSSLRAFCQGNRTSTHIKPIQMSMFAMVNDGSKEPLIKLDDLTISPIVEREMSATESAHRELCYKLEWEPVLEEENAHSEVQTNSVLHCYSNGVATHANGTVNGTSHTIPNGLSVQSAPKLNDIEGDVIIIHGDSIPQRELAHRLANDLEHLTDRKPEAGLLFDIETDYKLCIFISELDKPVLSSLTPGEFLSLQKMLTKVRGILWIVRGAYTNSSNPDVNMVTGLSRSIRSETLLKFATLDLDSSSLTSPEKMTGSILKVFKTIFNSQTEPNCDLEYMEKDGHLFTPRIIDDADMNEYVHKQTRIPVAEPTLFTQDERPLQMAIQVSGALETLHFVDQSTEDALSDDEIEVKVQAIGMNSRDLSVVIGQLEACTIGMEFSGIIVRTGSGVKKFAAGDRIAGISVSKGVYSTLTRTKEKLAFKINNETTFEVAAGIPVAYTAASHALRDLGGIDHGDRVLIHGAASAVGQAAICLAKLDGAIVFAIVRSSAERALMKQTFNLDDDQIFLSYLPSFESAIHLATRQARFDVVLNCCSADSDTMRTLWDSLGNFGCFIDIGRQSSGLRLETTQLDHNRSFSSVDLFSLASERPKIINRLLLDISQLLMDGQIQATGFIKVFPISEVEAAFKAFQSGSMTGKIVVSPRPGDQVMALPSQTHAKVLRPDASYILIGGTGSLGRSMARWMVCKGARNIVLVSRGASITGKVKDLVDELALTGATISVKKCDVANPDSVRNLLTKEMAGMPKVRGVVHGAMVLHDVLFEKMTIEQYTTVIESKVKGAWNFHNALKSEVLDFFVAISSAAGAVGNRGQAAYSAANTFLNAFVQHRISLGMPASSLDLTAVSDAGYLAENLEAAAEVSKNLGSDTICEAEVLALLSAAIDGTLARACNSHAITGVRITPSIPFWTNDAKFKHLRIAAEALAAETSSQPETVSHHTALKAAKTPEEAQEVICNGLLDILPSVLMLEREDMDITRSLSNYALDSLVAIEVRNFITREFEANLQVLELLSSGSIETLAKAICVKSKLVSF
ncbi:BcPKS8, polyketide synthase [Tricladium varicosporioides]|nr:BcPKS8, polyketide synthase [Hymenoscyphus varicosporioides]